MKLEMKDVPRFRRERDAALMSLDVETVYRFAKRWYRALPPRPDPVTEEKAMYMAIVRSETIPFEFRMRARRWLEERGIRP